MRTKRPLLRFGFLCQCCQKSTVNGVFVLPLKPHQKIINKTTREVLRPAGLVQKGTSRLWYLDCGWYACFAEFQPFSRRQGTTLNYGMSWLWYPQDHWTFDIFNRVEEFFDYEKEESFRSCVLALSYQAVEYCTQTQVAIKKPADAYAFVENHKEKTDWHAFNLAILAGLNDQADLAHSLFNAAFVSETSIAWQKDRNEVIEQLKGESTDRQAFERCINARIIEARARLKLDHTQVNYLP